MNYRSLLLSWSEYEKDFIAVLLGKFCPSTIPPLNDKKNDFYFIV
jgi:hypothetical protein